MNPRWIKWLLPAVLVVFTSCYPTQPNDKWGCSIKYLPRNLEEIPRSADLERLKFDYLRLCDGGLDTKIKRYYYFNTDFSFSPIPPLSPVGNYLLVIPRGRTLRFFSSNNWDSLVLVIYPLLRDEKYDSYAYYSLLILNDGRGSSSEPSITEAERALIHTDGSPKRQWKEQKAKYIDKALRAWDFEYRAAKCRSAAQKS